MKFEYIYNVGRVIGVISLTKYAERINCALRGGAEYSLNLLVMISI